MNALHFSDTLNADVKEVIEKYVLGDLHKVDLENGLNEMYKNLPVIIEEFVSHLHFTLTSSLTTSSKLVFEKMPLNLHGGNGNKMCDVNDYVINDVIQNTPGVIERCLRAKNKSK